MKVRDADAIHQLRTRVATGAFAVFFGFAGFAAGVLSGVQGFALLGVMLLSGVAAGLVVRQVTQGVSNAVALGIARSVLPTGTSTPYAKSYSYEQSLAARGDVAGAVEAYEAAMRANPNDPEPRVQAAELLRQGDPVRAAELFREGRRLAVDDRSRELYTTQRLIDLYLGPLGDAGRALVELRRLTDRFAGTREAEAARGVIASLKQQLRANAS